MSTISERAGISTFVIDYRIAPEWKFPVLTHGFIQMTRWSRACLAATEELADLIRKRIG